MDRMFVFRGIRELLLLTASRVISWARFYFSLD